MPDLDENKRIIRRYYDELWNKWRLDLVEELIAEGDKVVARLTYRGTHEGRLFGFEPTGREVSYAGAAIFRLKDGKIVDGWVLGDTLNLTRQIEVPNVSGPGIH